MFTKYEKRSTSVPFRHSKEMALRLERFAIDGGNMSKSKAVNFLIVKFITNPINVDVMDHITLREPLIESLSLTLDISIFDDLTRIATQYEITLSACIRIAIWRGLWDD